MELECFRIINEFESEIRLILPKDWIKRPGLSGPEIYFELNELNSAYKDSEYYFGKERKFVHWTSVQNLMSIVNNREIRFYNLHNSDDGKEFGYAASTLEIPDERINHSKGYLYTFSFCESSEIDNGYLWEEYGRNYSGVAIEFEIINEPGKWNNFMLFTKLYYRAEICFLLLHLILFTYIHYHRLNS